MPGRVHEHPAYSPDLNPIEQLGNLVKAKVRKYLAATTERNLTLEEMVRASWAEVADEDAHLKTLADSMRSRYVSCVEASGKNTRY